MSKVAAAAHAPFVAAVKPQFFGCQSIEEVEAIRDLDGLFSQPRFGQWLSLRDTPEASYLGLAFPRHVVRLPWNPERNPSPGLQFTEETHGERQKYLWKLGAAFGTESDPLVLSKRAGASTSAARQVADRSPDFRSIPSTSAAKQRCGFRWRCTFPTSANWSLLATESHRLCIAKELLKRCSSAFRPSSCRRNSAIRRTRRTRSSLPTWRTRFRCHGLRTTSRASCATNIGDNSDAKSLKEQLTSWLERYITKAVAPNDATMRRFPFKAAEVLVDPSPGRFGYYNCKVAILPHIQFEGMDIELRLESRLG